MEQWAILGITILSLLIMLGWLVYKSVKQNYPEGKKYTNKWDKYKINLIVHKRANLQDLPNLLRKSCLNAMKVLITSHNVLKVKKTVSGSVEPIEKYFKEYTIYIIPDYLMMPNTAAYTKKIYDIPTAVVSDKYIRDIIETGEPIIHEACHVVLNDYVATADDHSDETIWVAAGGELTLQGLARGTYKELNNLV